ncbi:MAG: hypothetical protein AAFO91_20090, partial [Bacteroidota bacterium]
MAKLCPFALSEAARSLVTEMSKFKRYASLVSGTVEVLLGGGIIYGWAPLSAVLAKEMYFCSDQNETEGENTNTTDNFTCPTEMKESQKENIAFVYTTATLVLSFSNVFSGTLYDRFGTFKTRIATSLLFLTGCLLMVLSGPGSNPILVFLGMCSLAVAGSLLLITNLQLGNLFGAFRALTVTLIEGATDSSAFVFLLAKLAHGQGISLQTFFLFLALLMLLQICRTLILMPVKYIPFPLPDDENYDYGLLSKCGSSDGKKQGHQDGGQQVSTVDRTDDVVRDE